MDIVNIKGLIKKHKLTLLGIVLGVVTGFLYWKNIGCRTHCMCIHRGL